MPVERREAREQLWLKSISSIHHDGHRGSLKVEHSTLLSVPSCPLWLGLPLTSSRAIARFLESLSADDAYRVRICGAAAGGGGFLFYLVALAGSKKQVLLQAMLASIKLVIAALERQ